MVRFLERRVGRYPFSSVGVLGTPVGGSLETQTLPVLSVRELEDAEAVAAVLLHELAHQWFGASTGIARWRDLWLAEGHATYYQTLYEHHIDPSVPLRERFERERASVVDLVRRLGPVARPDPAAFGSVESAPYSAVVYEGGATVLYALRRSVGPAAFERIERRYVARFRHRPASTADYLEVVREVGGPAAARSLRGWLTSRALPRLR